MNGYTYQLGPTGNRTSASEPSGRAVNWSYDGIYRLTQETISFYPHSNNGKATYGLDPVGNRLSQTSSLSALTSGSYTFDANDRLSTETDDGNGDTLVSGARSFVHDFENRLKSMTMKGSTMTVVYDGDGNRVAKTVGGASSRTTHFSGVPVGALIMPSTPKIRRPPRCRLRCLRSKSCASALKPLS